MQKNFPMDVNFQTDWGFAPINFKITPRGDGSFKNRQNKNLVIFKNLDGGDGFFENGAQLHGSRGYSWSHISVFLLQIYSKRIYIENSRE